MSFTSVANLSYTVFLTTSLSTILLSLLKSLGIVFNSFTSILSTSAFKVAKFDFSANLGVSIPVAFFRNIIIR